MADNSDGGGSHMDTDGEGKQEQKPNEAEKAGGEEDPYKLMGGAKLKDPQKPRPTDAAALALAEAGTVPPNIVLNNLPKPIFNAYMAARRRIQRRTRKFNAGHQGRGGLVSYQYSAMTPGAGFDVLNKDLGIPHSVLSIINRRFMEGAHDNQK
jgi:hypothetical protein